MKIAWFSPLPPSTSGIAAYSAELLPLLRERYAIDTFTASNAQDFVWKHRRTPYALTVYQLGNADAHDFMWGYLFRYPGMLVLHDAQVHQARALALTRRWIPRRADYLAELEAAHPEAPPHLGELVAAGLGGTLFHHWPMTRLVIAASRLTVVHNTRLADALTAAHPDAAIRAVSMGVSDPLEKWHADRDQRALAVAGVRDAHGIPADAVVVAAFGGVTPEKRLGPVLRAAAALAERHPRLHLMVVGSAVGHYDVQAEAARLGIAARVHVTGFVADDQLPDYLSAADVCACLRWPTNRETSASWLRAIAAGRTTIVTDLAHQGDVPTLDPRGWRRLDVHADPRPPVAVSIDVLDEAHSVELALERLAGDAGLRRTLGRAARAWWEAHHRLPPMAQAYDALVAEAMARPAPAAPLPRHLTDDGMERLRRLAAAMQVTDRVADVLAR